LLGERRPGREPPPDKGTARGGTPGVAAAKSIRTLSAPSAARPAAFLCRKRRRRPGRQPRTLRT